MNVNNLMAELERKHPGENEYLQAVREVLESIEEVYNQHPEFEKAKIVERLVEPDRIFTFRVTWVDDKGEVQTNLGYRVQFNLSLIHILSCSERKKTPQNSDHRGGIIRCRSRFGTTLLSKIYTLWEKYASFYSLS